MSNDEIKVGQYWYRMPHWNSDVKCLVDVKERRGHLWVDFGCGNPPERLDDALKGATLESVTEAESK